MAERCTPISTKPEPEKAIIVGVDTHTSEWSVDESLAELERLVQTDGGVVVTRITQRLETPNPRTFVGAGKAEEITQTAQALQAQLAVFDDELTPSQQSNLEHVVGSKIKVIDRTALILDIFAAHATTKEGRLQVNLAQAEYLLPRLRGMWSHLVREQTRGGIGGRFGMGESQLEVDRRLVRKRISHLKQELKTLDKQRKTQSKARWKSGIYRVALVGYTNAGKSTLLNALCGSDVYVRDELFATLDPTTRTIELQESRKITITDTVGFIQKLPTLLVDAFRTTLQEAMNADLLLEVADASDPHVLKELNVVNQTLKEINADKIPRLVVLNKCDLVSDADLHNLLRHYPQAVCISALQKKGLRGLLYHIAQEASRGDVSMTVGVPYNKGILMNMLHERCQVIHEEYKDKGLQATAKIPIRLKKVFEPYQVDAGSIASAEP